MYDTYIWAIPYDSNIYLLIVSTASKLDQLGSLICEVAGKEQHITRLHFNCKSHKQSWVDA